ncbi:MarR family transcriptional regulator [Nonomuraea sp. NPDC049141]|uniref:MarR family winged helix-turn-helix transcriptional regulator n=1 Tax=Nonomuraea sp. NPDC049141 TaxID=3155500 RepID=UPI0033E4CA91
MAVPGTHQPPDLFHLLTRAERLLGRRLAVILNAEGYSLDAWRVITLLADGTGHHMTEVAEHAFLPPGTLTKLMDQLVDDGLVYRRVDDIDRRRIRAYLTPRGRRLHRQLSRQVEAGVPRLLAASAEQDLLRDLLARLVDSLAHPPAARSESAAVDGRI